MRTFAHHSPETLEEAFALLERYRGAAWINAGGTDLLGVLKDDVHTAYPEALVSLKQIPGLDGIELDAEGLKIGAMARLGDLSSLADIGVGGGGLEEGEFTLIREAAGSVGTPQIRAVGTAGGNLLQEVRCWYYRYPRHVGGPVECLRKGGTTCPAVRGDNRYHAVMGAKRCHAVCPSDLAVALTALDATVRLTGPQAEREVPVRDLYSDLGTVLDADEVLTEIRVPRQAVGGEVAAGQATPGEPTPGRPPEGRPAGMRQAYRRLTLRKGVDFALVSVAAIVVTGGDGDVCTEARIALGGVSPAPMRSFAAEEALVGRPLDALTVAEAAHVALAGAKPLPKNAYKVQLAEVLIRDTITAASGRGEYREGGAGRAEDHR